MRSSGVGTQWFMQGFEHEITQAMTDAYASVCQLLGLAERVDSAADFIAMKIIRLVQQGETDSARLFQGVMQQCGLQEFGDRRAETERQSKSGSQH
jgi:hypothetical protein